MKKVLLASGYKLFLKKNVSLLKGLGFQLFTTTKGADALKLTEEHLFDLILIDFKLDDIDGCALCPFIRKEERSRNIPIIQFCHNIPGSIKRVEQSGASAMLLKPIDQIQLIETIGRFTGLQLGRTKRSAIKGIVISKTYDAEIVCISHDISNTGILIEAEYQLDLGSMITCKLALPGAYRMEIEGEVIRCINPPECEPLYGIKFINLPFSSRKLIDNYISSEANSGASAEATIIH